MTLTVDISLVTLFGGVVYVLCRYAGLKAWHAAICAMFGFLLASTPLAPEIRRLINDLTALTLN